MKILKYLLIFVPISFIAKFLGASPTIMFTLACLLIISLAGLMGEGDEEISFYSGPKIDGFLNGTFGNATELIISFFALKEGLFEVVKSSIAGGLKYKNHPFNQTVSDVPSSMLLFTVLGPCIPALFTHTVDPILLNTRYEGLGLFVAVIMSIIYVLSLFFSFKTHKHLYLMAEDASEHSLKWSLQKSILVLVIATILMAIESEFLVGGIESITESLGFSEFFV